MTKLYQLNKSVVPRAIHIDGARQHDRRLVIVDGVNVYLSPRSFEYLTHLAWHRQQQDGWVHKEIIEPGFNQARYLYRLREQVRAAYPGWLVYESGHNNGMYRLVVGTTKVSFNMTHLSEYPDVRLASLFTVTMSR